MGLIGLKEHTVKGAKSIADAAAFPRNRDGDCCFWQLRFAVKKR